MRIIQTLMSNQMLKILAVIFILSIWGCQKPTSIQKNDLVSYPENLRSFHENVISYHLQAAVDQEKVEDLLLELSENGSWLNIDYTDKIRGGWPVKNHLDHVHSLVVAYKKKGSKYTGDQNLSEKIHLALNFWLKNDFLSTNWHDQHIGVPERLLPILFLMEEELSKKQLDKAMELLYRAKIKMSGQNKVWLSTNVMLRSLLLRKADSVAIASQAIQDELQIAKGVGIKADWSYHEHGAHLQFGNYGLSYLEDMIKCYLLLNNTPFQFSDDKIEVLRNYILEGQQWVIWNKKYDISASGRKLFPNEQTHKYQSLKKCIEIMKSVDKAHAIDYDHAINSKMLVGDKHFWESDFHVHRAKDFYFSVKMSSSRVIGTESINGEHVKGYFSGDGLAFLYTGDEKYEDVLPYMDWKKLPGITRIQDDTELPTIKAWDFQTKGSFVGGVSNGQSGLAVMDYDRDGVKAHKSWFMFGDKILCLGSQINAQSPFVVTTGVNQMIGKGKVGIKENGIFKQAADRSQSLQAGWILHDNIGYLFLEKQDIKIESRFLEGSWNNLALRERPIILTDNVMRIWMDHGKNPRNAKYAFVLVPNTDPQTLDNLTITPPFTYRNTEEIQYAVNGEGNLAGIVFYKPGKVDLFGGISVDKPCVMLVEKLGNSYQVHVSDPSHELEKLSIGIQGIFTGESVKSLNNQSTISVILPSGQEAGKTKSFMLNI